MSIYKISISILIFFINIDLLDVGMALRAAEMARAEFCFGLNISWKQTIFILPYTYVYKE